jgi:hypothetical protein
MNDAQKRPAAQNPWYVLATLAGEQSVDFDFDLQEKNRAYWNAWASQGMTQAEKNFVNKEYGQGVLTDAPAWETVQAEVEALFKKRLPEVALPDPSAIVDFSNVAFLNPVRFAGFFFAAYAAFTSAAFSGDADFSNATFYGGASFSRAAFSGNTYFSRAAFSGTAYFVSAAFSGGADFRHAAFSGGATFNSAAFSGNAIFNSAAFSRDASFDNAAFSGALLQYANLERAFLEDADVQTLQVGGAMRPTDLSTCLGLTQAQLAKMKGDSGTLLPEGLEHPDHWPKLDAPPSEAIDEPSPFVFLCPCGSCPRRACRCVSEAAWFHRLVG